MSKPTAKKVRPPPTPKQPKPWDVRPLPKKGEWGPSKIHRSVGKALDCWSRAEISLGFVFAALVGKQDRRDGVLRAFGSVLTFRGRAEMLAAAAEVYFLIHPKSPSKKTFDTLMDTALGLSARRNEIAHGIVAPYFWFIPGRSKQWVLGPISFATNKRVIAPTKKLPQGLHLKPTYLYAAADINYFADEFEKLDDDAEKLQLTLEKEDAERQKSSLEKPGEPQKTPT